MAKQKAKERPDELDRKLGHVEASRVMMEDSLRMVRATAEAVPRIVARIARSTAAVTRSVQRLRRQRATKH